MLDNKAGLSVSLPELTNHTFLIPGATSPPKTLAYELLSSTGTIFVSIDDNEAARLKLLIDQTFGEKNFVGEMIRKTKTSTDDKATGFNLQHETLLVYAKNIKNVNLRGGEKDLENYKNPDNDPNGPWVSGDPTAASGTAERNYFAVKNPHTGREDFPPKGRFWFFSKNTLPNYTNSGQIVFRKTHKDTERGFTYKRYRDKLKSSRKPLKSLEYVDNAYMNDKGTKDLNNLLADSSFSYPKPATFIKDILVHATNNKKDAIVLDFFAGSGTPGQAVAELNAEDGGTRRCVLITNNENDIASPSLLVKL